MALLDFELHDTVGSPSAASPQDPLWFRLLAPRLRNSEDILLARLRIGLQLPRFTVAELEDPQNISHEVDRVVARIQRESRTPDDLADSAERVHRHGTYDVRRVPASVAHHIHTAHHYIGTPRVGLHYGLYHGKNESNAVPLCLLTFSDFDLPGVAALLPPFDPTRALVLSRVFAFRSAPKNAFSFAFRRALTHLRGIMPGLEIVTTYVNPNLGLDGASYRAANWALVGDEPISYVYRDSEYTTERVLIDQYGPDVLSAIDRPGSGLTRSRLPLLPLQVFAYRMQRKGLSARRDNAAAVSIGRT